ncbi:MAG: hypothetical protein OEZ19_00050 [Paracoccaceae bacterium]|nr:hypothetical protein [Paracoccaceae bacterium]
MGTFSDWSYTAKCTVWEPTLDEYDQPSSYTRTVHDCSFKAGGDLAANDVGERFMPKTTIYLAATDANAPKVGSYVVTGESLASAPTVDAEIIRAAMKHDSSLFDEGTPDRVLVTG